MPAGRKPKPTHLKVLEGNPGRRPLNTNEPKPDPTAPTAPAWLSREAKAEWRRVVPELDRLGLLSRIDRAALVVYVEAWSQHVDACKQVAEEGLIVTGHRNMRVKHPALQVARDTAQTISKMCAEFGLSPSSRSRMSLPEKDDSEFERMSQPQRHASN